MIEPILPEQRDRVVARTYHYIERASELFGKKLHPIPVNFDLIGRNAGMYRVRGHVREIRYNPYIFAKYFEQNLRTTVPHEVAHYVVDTLHGFRNVRPHGAEWRQVMAALGCRAQRTCDYDLSGVPQRRQRRFTYKCNCSTHQLSTSRHNKICRGSAQYLCKKCQCRLCPVDAPVDV